jgi:hypothetical protein
MNKHAEDFYPRKFDADLEGDRESGGADESGNEGVKSRVK